MAKRKPQVEWDVESSSAYMASQFAAQKIKVLAGCEGSAESAASDVGIYLPHLCQRLLFQRTCYPLERTMILFGPTGSNKSSLLYWFYLLFLKNGGMYLHAEVEDKDTATLRSAVTKYPKDGLGHLRRCASMNDFMSVVRGGFDWFKSAGSDKKGGPGRRVPYVVGIDSLVAKMTEEASAVIEKANGVPGRRFADEARALADWFKIVPTYMHGWPFSLIAVNHDKPKPGQTVGSVIHHAPGGSAPNYFATYKILMEKVATLKQKASGWEGNRIRLKTEKCGLAAGQRAIEVEFVWRMVTLPSRSGKTTSGQQAVWNWDKATIENLYSLILNRGKRDKARAAAVADILGLQRGSAGRYHAPGLGVGPSDAMPASALGRLLEQNREVLDELEPKLGIHRSYRYEPGRPFEEQTAEAAAQVDDFIPAPIEDVDPDDRDDDEEEEVADE